MENTMANIVPEARAAGVVFHDDPATVIQQVRNPYCADPNQMIRALIERRTIDGVRWTGSTGSRPNAPTGVEVTWSPRSSRYELVRFLPRHHHPEPAGTRRVVLASAPEEGLIP